MSGIKKLRLGLMAGFFFPAMAHAADVVTVINKVTMYLQGPFAGAVGFLAIVIGGFLCFKGIFPKMYFMMMLIGFGLIFGASYYYKLVAS